MKLLLLFVLLLTQVHADDDYDIVDGEIYSPLMTAPIPYWAMIPKNVSGKIPVVYFLHGKDSSRFHFREVGGEKILREKGKKFAVVALTGKFLGHNTYWVNDATDKKFLWRDVVLKEMIPEIEKKYNLGGAKENRMIAGISMGSHGAYQLALTSGIFQCVAGHSLVVRSYVSMSQEFPGVFGSLDEYRTRDPLSLLKQYEKRSELPFKSFWLDIGGKDDPMFLARATLVEKELSRLGVLSQDYVDVGKARPQGKHDNAYWTARMPEYLEWYNRCFYSE